VEFLRHPRPVDLLLLPHLHRQVRAALHHHLHHQVKEDLLHLQECQA